MSVRIMHRRIGRYSGPVIYGQTKAEPPTGRTADFHSERAYWLRGETETGNKLGSIMGADGTVFTLGRDQHVMVYPRELADEDFNAADDQGAAFELLAKLETSGSQHVQPVWDAFKAEGWYVGREGRLRWIDYGSAVVKRRRLEHKGGDLVHGALIREKLTPPNGVVPKEGDAWATARRWAGLLHALTADPRTGDIQHAFGLGHLIGRVRSRKVQVHPRRRRVTVQKLLYGDYDIATAKSTYFSPVYDLALCVLHSHSVNAPSVAYKLLLDVVQESGWDASVSGYLGSTREIAFARALLRAIKTKRYGRWGQRWERTRKHAMNVGWWPRSLFTGDGAAMPK